MTGKKYLLVLIEDTLAFLIEHLEGVEKGPLGVGTCQSNKHSFRSATKLSDIANNSFHFKRERLKLFSRS